MAGYPRGGGRNRRGGGGGHSYFGRRDWDRGSGHMGADSLDWRSPLPEPELPPVQSQTVPLTDDWHQECAQFLQECWDKAKSNDKITVYTANNNRKEPVQTRLAPLNIDEWAQNQQTPGS